ncbi:MAG TPA: HAD family hydrolase [Gemmatimonadaceae bacterium]|jgi:HAD superfamily hydrolase (TIGR01509 family)
MKPDLIIFDCDGVLVDSEAITNSIFAEMLGELGLYLSIAEVRREFVGLSFASCAVKLEQMLGRALPPEFEREYDRRTHAALAAEVGPVRGIPDVVATLADAGIPTCVASSGSHDKMRVTLGRSGLLERFEGRRFSTSEVARGKPHPDIFLHAAEQFGAAPERTVVVEDSVHGIRAAVSAGMIAVGYAEVTDAQLLSGAGATYTIDDMSQLIDLVSRHR